MNDRQFIKWVEDYDSPPFEYENRSFNIPWVEACYSRFSDVVSEFELIVEEYLHRQELTLLDVGFFPGTLLKVIKKLYRQNEKWTFHGVGLTLPQEFIHHMESFGIHSHHVNLDPALNPPATRDIPILIPLEADTVDVAFCTEIMEHLIQPSHMTREVRRVLKPGGILIVTTPNLATLGNRIRLLFGKSIFMSMEDWTGYMEQDWRPHFREYTMAELCSFFTSEGFSVIRARFQNLKWSRKMLGTLPVTRRIARYLYNFVPALFPPFSQGLMLTIKKK